MTFLSQGISTDHRVLRMPRFDTSVILHHVIIGGTEKHPIFSNINNRPDFFDWTKVDVTGILAVKYDKGTYIIVMTGG
jgi:hypothetical protein